MLIFIMQFDFVICNVNCDVEVFITPCNTISPFIMCCSTVGNIMMHVGDILSTVGDVQYRGEYHEYREGVQYRGVLK